MKIDEMIEVLRAFKEGKEVEYLNGTEWDTIINRGFTCFNFDKEWYRIKPELTREEYIPFTWEDRELFRDKWIRLKGGDIERKIICIDKPNFINVYGLDDGYNAISFGIAFEDYEFVDGTPFGKLK